MQDILSVGIDIGTSTTQIVFSRMKLKNTMGYFTVPRVSIVRKEVVYRSSVYITPLRSRTLIDADGMRRIVEEEYRNAGVLPEQVDTGAVIITGESALKENAASVTESLSGYAGNFVVSCAGPDLESVIAGKGSGAWQYSLDHHCMAMNLDVGGGTTNIVLFKDGETVGCSCFDIGGRLIRYDKDMTVQYISSSAAKIIASLGLEIEEGKRTNIGDLRILTDKMADLLAVSIGLWPEGSEQKNSDKAEMSLLEQIRTPNSGEFYPDAGEINAVFFSGGVAECMTHRKMKPGVYGDLGVLLADSLLDGTICLQLPVITGSETIRATVVGAGTYTTTISGSTITYADRLFPLRNIPVLYVSNSEQEALLEGENSERLSQKIRWFLQQSSSGQLALGLRGVEDPSYHQVKRLAEGLSAAVERALPEGQPMIVILEKDMGKALGILIRQQIGNGRPVACIDGIVVKDGDYVDMGSPLMNGLVIPVIVKTLIYGSGGNHETEYSAGR